MPAKPSLERVIVVPRNGYLNRIQAWASSAILAEDFGIPLHVLWEHENVAPARPEDLFAASLVASTFTSRADVEEILGSAHEQMPRYLTPIPERGVLLLAGHDRGEQAFMPEVERAIIDFPWLRTLVIVAGGKFHLEGEAGFTERRRRFYGELSWSESIDARTSNALVGRGTFNALHLRGTDHALSAPRDSQFKKALIRLARTSEITNLFIAADSAGTRARWTAIARELHLEPWSIADISLERSTAGAGIDALVDWRVLASSDALIYSSVSTFAEEAAVASGNYERAVPLHASKTTQRTRTYERMLFSAVTYPRRKMMRR